MIEFKVQPLHHSPSSIGSEIPEMGWPTDMPARACGPYSRVIEEGGWGGVEEDVSIAIGKSMWAGFSRLSIETESVRPLRSNLLTYPLVLLTRVMSEEEC